MTHMLLTAEAKQWADLQDRQMMERGCMAACKRCRALLLLLPLVLVVLVLVLQIGLQVVG